MNKACNPLQRKGVRNVFCPLYNRCLNRAVKESWRHFACGDCLNKLDQGLRPEMMPMAIDLLEHYDLRLKL
jgi:hypothetical protein